MYDPAAQQELAEFIATTIVISANGVLRATTFVLSFYIAHGPYSTIEAVAFATFVLVTGWASRHVGKRLAPRFDVTRIMEIAFVWLSAIVFTVAASSYSVIGSALLAVCLAVMAITRLSIDITIGDRDDAAGRMVAEITRSQETRKDFQRFLLEHIRKNPERFDEPTMGKFRKELGDEFMDAVIHEMDTDSADSADADSANSADANSVDSNVCEEALMCT